MNKTKEKTALKTKPKAKAQPKKRSTPKAKAVEAVESKTKAKKPATPKTKTKDARDIDSYYDGEKLYAVSGGRYIQFNGIGPLPDDIAVFMDRTGRKPPFMLLPEMSVDFYLSKGFGGSSKVHWPGEGKLPESVIAYLNDHGTLPRTRENNEDDEEYEDEAEEEKFE